MYHIHTKYKLHPWQNLFVIAFFVLHFEHVLVIKPVEDFIFVDFLVPADD